MEKVVVQSELDGDELNQLLMYWGEVVKRTADSVWEGSDGRVLYATGRIKELRALRVRWKTRMQERAEALSRAE